jgi:FOG: TPR repeat, SEL1 subfamily
MKRLITTLCLTISLTFGSFGVGWSGDFQKGVDAYDKGDYATALKEFMPLAEQGDASAQYNLGQIYRQGLGVPEDYKTAVKWNTLAAEQGHAKAQYNLGMMYDNGQGVLQDYKTAVKWYILSAEQGHAKAQYNLGVTYALGQGVIEDKVYAHMWANIANSNGHENGKKLMEFLLEQGITPSQIEKAQDLARECVKKNYKGC